MNWDTVPIVDVHLDNFRQLWPSILLAVRTSSFIALDLELSGLGNRKLLIASSVQERYKAISNAAKTRSIISVGLSCFKMLNENTGSSNPRTRQMWKYYVQTFNITTLCCQDFIVEPEALKFLVSHGFDFNKQYSKGVPYSKGNDKEGETSEPCIRSLFTEILRANRSLVLHNGLVDLIFMYQCWYAELPATIDTFAADVFEAYPGGIYDTKYIAEFLARTSASYLEYVFRKLQRENETKAAANRPHVSISFMKFKPDMPYVEYHHLSVDTAGQNTIKPSHICMTYAYHGWCPKADSCSLSHNVNCVLDMEGGPVKQKKKLKLSQLQMCENYSSKRMKIIVVPDKGASKKTQTQEDGSLPSQVCHSLYSSMTNDSHQDENLFLQQRSQSSSAFTSAKAQENLSTPRESHKSAVSESCVISENIYNISAEDVHSEVVLNTDNQPCVLSSEPVSNNTDSHVTASFCKPELAATVSSKKDQLTTSADHRSALLNSSCKPTVLQTNSCIQTDFLELLDQKPCIVHSSTSVRNRCEQNNILGPDNKPYDGYKVTPSVSYNLLLVKQNDCLEDTLEIVESMRSMVSDVNTTEQLAGLSESSTKYPKITTTATRESCKENEKNDATSSDANMYTPLKDHNCTDSSAEDSWYLAKNETAATPHNTSAQNVKSVANICAIKRQEMEFDEKSCTEDSAISKITNSAARLRQKSRGHRAGCDAFMTGFIMSVFIARYGVHPSKASLFSPEHLHTKELVNKIFLSGKNIPFLIRKSQFTKTSKCHQEKIQTLQKISQ